MRQTTGHSGMQWQHAIIAIFGPDTQHNYQTNTGKLIWQLELEQILVLIPDHMRFTADQLGAGLFLQIGTGPTNSTSS